MNRSRSGTAPCDRSPEYLRPREARLSLAEGLVCSVSSNLYVRRAGPGVLDFADTPGHPLVHVGVRDGLLRPAESSRVSLVHLRFDRLKVVSTVRPEETGALT